VTLILRLKIPIFENSIDQIIGVVHSKDLFNKSSTIRDVMRTVNYYPETKLSMDLLKEFVEEDMQIGIIVDEYGGTAGIVTSEDLIEELLGDIRDEYDIEENICRKIADKTFLISGRSEIDNINEKIKIDIPIGNYETFAGYVIAKLGKIPNEGEEYIIDDFKIYVIKSTQTKIDLLKVIDQRQVED
jgi:putative hemolysin